MIAFTSRLLYTPSESINNAVVLVRNGAILSVAPREEKELTAEGKLVDFGDCIIVPGFIDIHIHGSAGYDVMQSDQTARAGFETFLARHGVTRYCPTTVAAPVGTIQSALERLADAVEAQPAGASGARPLGIHLEGPFISRACRGAHPAENLLVPTLATFEKFWQAARGHIRVITIAPELEGAPEVIAEATRRGVCVSLGHSDATLESARHGFAAGARHATHPFNAMRRLDHRDPGLLGTVLSDDRVTCDLIADGIHVDTAVVKIFLKAKGPERAVLITDAISAT